MHTRLAASCSMLLSLAACGPDQASAQSESGSESDTGEPEPLEPACELGWEWALRVEQYDYQYPQARSARIDIDALGNVYALSSVSPADQADLWVSKWSSDGTQAWTRTWGDPSLAEFGKDIRVGQAGELFVLGSRGVAPSPVLVFARLDPMTGEELWSEQVDGVWAADLALTPDGQLMLLGNIAVPDSGDYVPWLSERSPVDGSETWTRDQPIFLNTEQTTAWSDRVGVSDTGEIRVVGAWNYASWHGDFAVHSDALLLQFDALGELLDAEIIPTEDYGTPSWILPVALDGSRDIYYRRDASPATLESRSPDHASNWLLEQSAWSVGEGDRWLDIMGLRGDTLDVGGTIREFPDGGMPLWTATIARDTGVVTRGCVHAVVDADSGVPMRQVIHAAVSHPNGGFVALGDQDSLDANGDGAYWIWLRHFAG